VTLKRSVQHNNNLFLTTIKTGKKNLWDHFLGELRDQAAMPSKRIARPYTLVIQVPEV